MSRKALKLDGITCEERIRQMIEEHGGAFANYREIARLAINEGIFSADKLDGFQLQGAMKAVKDASRTGHVEGIPFAGVINEENNVKQYELWTYEEATYNFLMKAASAKRDVAALRILHAAIFGKFGRAPEFPRFDP